MEWKRDPSSYCSGSDEKMRIPLSLSDSLTTGTYAFTFKDVSNFSAVPKLALPLDFSVLGKHITIVETTPDYVNKTFEIVIVINENPIPIGAIALGLLVVLALSLTFMSLDKVEKIIDSPVADIGIVAVALGVIYLVFRFSSAGAS